MGSCSRGGNPKEAAQVPPCLLWKETTEEASSLAANPAFNFRTATTFFVFKRKES